LFDDRTGVVVRISKKSPYSWYTMPQYLDWPVKDRRSWEEYKERLDPHDIRRYPKDWDKDAYREMFKNYSKGPTRIMFNGFFGFGAQIMGLERFLMMFHKDPDFIHELACFWEFFTIELFKPFLEAC